MIPALAVLRIKELEDSLNQAGIVAEERCAELAAARERITALEAEITGLISTDADALIRASQDREFHLIGMLDRARDRIAELEEGGKLLVADILSRISKIAELEAELRKPIIEPSFVLEVTCPQCGFEGRIYPNGIVWDDSP